MDAPFLGHSLPLYIDHQTHSDLEQGNLHNEQDHQKGRSPAPHGVLLK